MTGKPLAMLGAILLIVSLGTHAAQPPVQPYLAPQALDLAAFLPPPPLAGSSEDRQDLEAVLLVQGQRTPQQVAQAKRDDHLSDAVFPFAGEIFGPQFTLDRHPLTAQFFRRTLKDLVQTLMPAKAHFARPRPYELSAEVKPVLAPPMGESYPSGHTMDAYLSAILLARMVPEKRDELFARAAAAGKAEWWPGVHYPTDLEGGRISAVALAVELLHNPEALDDFNRARRELRATLALD